MNFWTALPALGTKMTELNLDKKKSATVHSALHGKGDSERFHVHPVNKILVEVVVI